MKDNILLDKSFAFAVRVVKLYKYLCDDKKEYVLSKVANSGYEVNFPRKQLLRCGTSIGANINESQDAQSTNDFISKLSISLKEAREAKYWIELLKETNYLTDKEATSISKDLLEVIKLLVSIIKTTKQNKVNEKLKMENGK